MPGTTSSDPRVSDVDIARLLACGAAAAVVSTPPSDPAPEAENASESEAVPGGPAAPAEGDAGEPDSGE